MLLLLAEYLTRFQSGFNVFSYLTLRAILAVMTALAIALLVGPGLIERLTHHLLAASPAAIAATKRLLADVVEAPMDDVLLAATAKCIADVRVSTEGREGIAAFLEKRAPSWMPKK